MLTYLDSNVMVQAATGANQTIQMRALAIITDPNRQFVSSLFSRMEVIPLAVHFGRGKERLFYETFFQRVQIWVIRWTFMMTPINWRVSTLWARWIPFI